MQKYIEVEPGDPRYLDPEHYWPKVPAGENWALARVLQVRAAEKHRKEMLRSRGRTTISGYKPGKGTYPWGAKPVSEIVSGANGLRQAFPDLIPSKPYCTDHPQHGVIIRPRATALKRRHVQLNGKQATVWLAFDVDRPTAYFAARDADLPVPNFIAENPDNGHAHLAYLLAVPVQQFDVSRLAPIRYAADVQRGLRRRLDADAGYVGLIAKNPLHADWRVEWHDEPYDLGELACHLTKADMRGEVRREREAGLGRNVSIFDSLRYWAYEHVRAHKAAGRSQSDWFDLCLYVAGQHNAGFYTPLPQSEVRLIAKSVARWTWVHFDAATFSKIQSLRGKRSMTKRWAGHIAESTTKPWLDLGISERTYYRRKAKGQTDGSQESGSQAA
jgi:hypothetical protein